MRVSEPLMTKIVHLALSCLGSFCHGVISLSLSLYLDEYKDIYIYIYIQSSAQLDADEVGKQCAMKHSRGKRDMGKTSQMHPWEKNKC